MTVLPSRKEFKDKAGEGNLIPIYTEVYADLETPVSAYLKLRRGENTFLLESVEGGTQIGRYSFLGRDPSIIFEARGRTVTIRRGSQKITIQSADALQELKDLTQELVPVADPALPPFAGGAVGYIAYDLVRQLENLPETNPDDLVVPDMLFMFTDTIVAFDNVSHKLIVMHNVQARSGDNLDLLYDQAVGVLQQILADLRHPLPETRAQDGRIEDADRLNANFEREDFLRAVETCKRYITQGDIIQAVLSQRLDTTFEGDAFSLYRALRIVNPSPYMFYLHFGDIKLVGASPEIHVRSYGGNVTIRPIAGTRPRGESVEEDMRLEKELLADEKERAEHLMLVDLARNDIGRVCRYGSVRVTEYMVVERYSHVMHIVSDVEGILEEDRDAFDLIAATFPAGTVSGAPKIRAMEIIEELEPTRRGPYAGLVGYFSFNGNFDSCITIRTMLVHDDKVSIQAGAGIVADSIPEREYEETLNKAKALFRAIQMAKGGSL
ncbi:MAG: anthranilate synthase component I [Spirochaetaceae bacterium]|nr:MAG: anthranilate synthase component I [Spirochaetaceae bacterium]